MNILKSKEIWMRKSSCMEDYLEIQYGLDRLYRAYRNPKIGDHFKSVLNGLFDGIAIDIEKNFDGWTPHFLADTYFTCVSEHSDEEDTFGRLSMWRAYGDTTGVAFVLNNPLFLNPAEGLKATVNPVSYLNDDEFENEFTRITDNISKEAEFFKAHERDEVIARIFHMLRFAVLCTKHPGFREEREWRVIYCPTLEASSYLTKDIRPIRNVPQPIYKIPLEDIPEVGYFAAIPALINRIVIGPTQYPAALREAFVGLLDELGVSDSASKVCVSDIPLRR